LENRERTPEIKPMTNAIATPRLDVRAIFGQVIASLLDGDEKDRTNEAGRTYVEQLAFQIFLDPEAAAKLTTAAQLPEIKADGTPAKPTGRSLSVGLAAA
jgi:hypothetical protein